MSPPDLAPRHASKQSSCSDNPFASPIASTYILTAPQPCAQSPHRHHDRRPSRALTAGGSVDSRYGSTDYSYVGGGGYKKGSMSSTAASSIMTPMSSFDLEKANAAKERPPKRTSRESKRSGGTRDLEKAKPRGSPHGSYHSNTRHATNTIELEDDDEEADEVDEARATQEQKAVKILFFLAGPCVALSAVNALWAVIALLITTLSQPIRICAKRPSFGQQLSGLLGPTLNLQLRCIYTPLPPHANEDRSYHNGMLLIVHLLSPFLSFAIIFAAWLLAVYWICSGMVGDPAGQDKRDDGKETVLGLRNWWERWLLRSVIEE